MCIRDRGADVIALAHALRRVVVLPEDLQDVTVADDARIEDDPHDFRVPGGAAADLFIGRVRRRAAGIAHRRRIDALGFPELALGAPEAALSLIHISEPTRLLSI